MQLEITIPFHRNSRAENLRRLEEGGFDVLIVGGGINGAGLARDLALRSARTGQPLRIALVEQRHFASGTSSRNSQLIHGGLRYLKYLEFRLVREALRERAVLLRIAPHLVKPLPFLIPFYGWTQRLYYDAGLILYDWLAGRQNVGRHRHLSQAQVAGSEPHLKIDGLHSAAIYYDCKVHSARLVLENLFDAARLGAIIVNYTRALAWHKQAQGFRVELQDMLTGRRFSTTARKIADATGPWQSIPHLRRVRGSHLVFPKLTVGDYAIAHFARDGRIIFVIPWGPKNELSLVGTTDVDHDAGPDDVHISPSEIDYLCRIIRELLPFSRGVQPISAYSSLRPLADARSASATAASREHHISYAEDGALHITGGKYTTYRLMSAEAADMLSQELCLALVGQSFTAAEPVGGNSPERYEQLRAQAPQLAPKFGLSPDEATWVIDHYGLLTPQLLAYLPDQPPEGLTRLEAAVIRFAVEHEMAQKLADVLFVSTYWGWERSWTDAQLELFARELGRHLCWPENQYAAEIRLVRKLSSLPAPVGH